MISLLMANFLPKNYLFPLEKLNVNGMGHTFCNLRAFLNAPCSVQSSDTSRQLFPSGHDPRLCFRLQLEPFFDILLYSAAFKQNIYLFFFLHLQHGSVRCEASNLQENKNRRKGFFFATLLKEVNRIIHSFTPTVGPKSRPGNTFVFLLVFLIKQQALFSCDL